VASNKNVQDKRVQTWIAAECSNIQSLDYRLKSIE